MSGISIGTGIFLIFTLPYKFITQGYFSTYYILSFILGIVLTGTGAYIILKKQKWIAIGICIIVFIICVLVFSRMVGFVKLFI